MEDDKMQIEALDYLIAIEKFGSTRKAADALNTSYQNVSRVLLQVEEEWDVTLFRRGTKGMEPTEEGKLAIATAREMLHKYQHMLEQFQYRKEIFQPVCDHRAHGELELHSTMITSNGFLNDLLVEFSLAYPGIQVNLREKDAYVEKREPSGRLYVKPRMYHDLEKQQGDLIYPLLEDKLAMVVKKDSILNTQKTISLKQLIKLPIVLVAQNRWEDSIAGDILRSNGLIPKKPIYTSSVIGLQKYVASGQYIGMSTEILSSKLVSDRRDIFDIISVRDKEAEFFHCLTVYDAEHLTRNEQHFVTFIKESFHIETETK